MKVEAPIARISTGSLARCGFGKTVRWCFLASAFFLFAVSVLHAQQPASSQDATLRAAVCPIVYPYDIAAGSKGLRYTFYGNAFFINSQGYLVTAAHVLQTFRDSGQPYILLDRPNAPPQTVKANLVCRLLPDDVK